MTAIWVALSGLVLLSGGWLVFERFWDRRQFRRGPSGDAVINLRARKAERLLHEEPGTVVLDVRPAASWRAGHLPGAVNAPFAMDGGGFAAGSLGDIPRETPLLVYCDGGFRSRLALPALRAAGFRRIHHLHRGLMSWRVAALPVETVNS